MPWKQSSEKSERPRSRRPAFAIVLLVGFMAVVFWFIIQRQLGSAEERRLRLLAGFADRVEATVSDLGDRFGRVMTERCPNQVADYLALLPQVEYVASVPDDATDCRPAGRAAEGEPGVPSAENPGGLGGGAGVEEAGTLMARQKATTATVEDEASAELIAEPGITMRSAGANVQLRYRRAEGLEPREGGPSPLVEVAVARLDVKSVIEPMVIPGVFDSILVTDEQGTVLYQQGDPELRATHLDGLLGDLSGSDGGESDWAAALTNLGRGEAGEAERRRLLESGRFDEDRSRSATGRATTIVETSIAGSDHAVFLQPVTLRLSPLASRPAPEPVHWIAVGVISSEHLLSAGVTTSPILLFLLIAILPAGLVAWPFLKLFLISRRQPFTRLDCAFLVLACVLALAFGAILLFDGLFVANVRGTVDRQLEKVAEVVHRSLRLEVVDAYRQLADLDAAGVGFDEKDDLAYFQDGSDDGGASQRTPGSFLESTIADVFDLHPPDIYPYFDSVFWATPEGTLENANLPLRKHAVLPQEVADREYFRCALDWTDPYSLDLSQGDVDRYEETRGAPLDGRLADGTIQLCLQPFLDRTTGEAVTAVSRRSAGWGEEDDPKGWGAERPVAALVARLTSVTHPVLPPQIQFAVVGDGGQVLFHSDSRRALTEDFLKATDENRLLQSLLNNEREGHLPLHYWGRRHRAFVLPVEDLPWTLVVLRSMEDLRLRNFELIYDFLNPYLLSLGSLALLALVFKLVSSHRFRAYLWPTPRHLGAYRWIVLWTLGWMGAFTVLLVWGTAARQVLFYASLGLAPLTFGYVVWFLPRFGPDRRADADAPRLPERWITLGRRVGRLPVRAFAALASRAEAARDTATAGENGEASHPTPEYPGSGAEKNAGPKSWNRYRVRAREHRKGLGLVFGGLVVALAVMLLSGPVAFGWTALLLCILAVPSAPRWRFGAHGGPGGANEQTHAERVKRWKRVRARKAWLAGCFLVVVTLAALHLQVDLMVVWLVLVFAVVRFALQWFRFEFDGDRERRRTAYIFTLGCLLLLSLLPALGFFHLARSRQIQFLTQDATLALERSLRSRAEELEDRQGPLPYYRSYRATLDCVSNEFLAAVFDTRTVAGAGFCPDSGTPAPPAETEEVDLWPFGQRGGLGEADGGAGLANRIVSSRPLALNELATRPFGVDLSRFGFSGGDWRGLRSRREEWVKLTKTEAREAEASPVAAPYPTALASLVPPVGSVPEFELWQALLGLGLLALAVGPFLLSRFLAEELLLISLVYYGDPRQETDGGASGNRDKRDARPSNLARSLRPGESLEEVLDEVRSVERSEAETEPVKRLVIVAGQLQREAWQEKVGPHGDDELPPFWEARFREAWKRVVAEVPPEPASAEAGGAAGSSDGAVETAGSPSRSERFAELLLGDSEKGRPILIAEFDPILEDPVAAAEQTDALRSLIEHHRRSVVVLAETVPLSGSWDPDSSVARAARSRWIELLGAFPVRYARDTRLAGEFGVKLLEIDSRLGATVHTGDERREDDEASDLYRLGHWHRLLRTIKEECRPTPTLQQLGKQLIDELFAEVRKRDLEKRVGSLREEIALLREQVENPDLLEIEHRIHRARNEEELSSLEERIGRLRPRERPPDDPGENALPSGEATAATSERGEAAPEVSQPALERLGGALAEKREELAQQGTSKDGTISGPPEVDIPQEVEKRAEEMARAERRLAITEIRLRCLEEGQGTKSYRTLLTEQHVVTRVGAQARLHYLFLWSKCTRDEKLVLVQLAHHGLVNPKYSGWVLDLMQKGLVVRDPDIRLMNWSFERFVRQETRKSQVLEWQEELGPNAWSVLKWLLPFPLLALAGFLFITQRDAVSNAAGVLVALASLTPVVFNLYDKFQEVNLRQGSAGDDAD